MEIIFKLFSLAMSLACWGGIIALGIACVNQIRESREARKPPAPCTPQQLDQEMAKAKAEAEAKEKAREAREAKIANREKGTLQDLAKIDKITQFSILSDCDELSHAVRSIIKVRLSGVIDYEDINCDYNKSIARLLEIQQQFSEYSYLSDCLRKITDKFRLSMARFVSNSTKLRSYVCTRTGRTVTVKEQTESILRSLWLFPESVKSIGKSYGVASLVEIRYAMDEVDYLRAMIEKDRRQKQRQKSKNNPK